MADYNILTDWTAWTEAINEAQFRDDPVKTELVDILREGSYLFYDFKDIHKEYPFLDETGAEDKYTKDISPLFSLDILDQPVYWDLLKVITEDIPFYYQEPTLELTVNEDPMWSNGINLSKTLPLDDFRDPGTLDVPTAIHDSEFWSAWLRDTLGYYRNKLILDIYNKMQYPFLNEHQFLNAGLFPSLVHTIYIGNSEVSDLLDFQTDALTSSSVSIDDVGNPAYLSEVIDSKLQGIYALLDYHPDSAEILSDWVTSLYQVGMIPAQDLEREKSIYRLQDVKYELLKRKFAGTSTLYQLILKSINRSGSYISTVPASSIGNSKAAYAPFNEKRNIRLIDIPGITSSSAGQSDYPFDIIYEFYTRPLAEGSGREVPLDILYPLFYSAAATYGSSYTATVSENQNEMWVTAANELDKSYSRSSYGPSGGAAPLRTETNTLVWDTLTGLTTSQNISQIYTTLDEKTYSESEESVDPTAYIHMDPMTTRDPSTGEVKQVIRTLDERQPYANLSDITGHVLDLSANTLLYHENTFQQLQKETYDYLTYPITDNLSVSLMDMSWVSYIKSSSDQKSRVQEEVSAGIQVSSYNDVSSPQTTEYPIFYLSRQFLQETRRDKEYASDEQYFADKTSNWYLWYSTVKYSVQDFTLASSQPVPHLMSKIFLAENLQTLEREIDHDSEAAKYNVGLMPLTYMDLSNTDIEALNYGYNSELRTYQDDFADKGFTKGYFVFSTWDLFTGKRNKASAAQASFLGYDPEIQSEEHFKTSILNYRTIDRSYQNYLQPYPTADTKTVFFILRKENLDWYNTIQQYGEDSDEFKNLVNSGVTQYSYTWSDPIPVLFLKDITDTLYANSSKTSLIYPDWWGISYYLNPYLNFTADSASPLRHKKVLAGYKSSTSIFGVDTTEGASQLAALSNLSRFRHLGINCNDNGLQTIYHTDANSGISTSLNTLLDLKVNNPLVPESATETEIRNSAWSGLYLDHNYSFDQDLAIIQSLSEEAKKQIQADAQCLGDNRKRHPLYEQNTAINQSLENIPCLEYKPASLITEDIKARINENLTLRPYQATTAEPTPTGNNKWLWTPGKDNQYPLSEARYGCTVCLNAQFNFAYNSETQYLPLDLTRPQSPATAADPVYAYGLKDQIKAELTVLKTKEEAYAHAEEILEKVLDNEITGITIEEAQAVVDSAKTELAVAKKAATLAAFDQVLIEQPRLFRLWYIGLKGDSSETRGIDTVNDSLRAEHKGTVCFEYYPKPGTDKVIRVFSDIQITEDIPYRMTAGWVVSKEGTTLTVYLLVNNSYNECKVYLQREYDPSDSTYTIEILTPEDLVDPSWPIPYKVRTTDTQIRLGYSACTLGAPGVVTDDNDQVIHWNETIKAFNSCQRFYGQIYDLRLYPIGFEKLNLQLLNQGMFRELYSYGPSSYKLAYSIYQDPSILKAVAMNVPDWSVLKIRALNRGTWDSILTDMYPVSLMEQDRRTWLYTADYYDPEDDPDIYQQKRTLDLDITSDQISILQGNLTDAERAALLSSWKLEVPATYRVDNEYASCIEQTLKKNAEVINGPVPLLADEEDLKLTYKGKEYTVNAGDSVSIITTTIYPVQYSKWPYVSYNPEENLTPALSLSADNGLSSVKNREIYLPTNIESADDDIEYTADLDINFRVAPTFSAVRAYSSGSNITYLMNNSLKAVVAKLDQANHQVSSSKANHILMGMAVPRQKNMKSDQLGVLTKFNLKNFTLHQKFKYFLRAASYYTELQVPIPYFGTSKIYFASRWHAIRHLKEGSYYFTCKYPIQIMPFLDQDYVALANQTSIVTSFLTVRFKIEVKGTPKTYNPTALDPDPRVPTIEDTAWASVPTYSDYLSSNLETRLSDSTRLYQPEDNRTFPHRVMSVNLYVQDLKEAAVQNPKPESYVWRLLASNDEDICDKDSSVLHLTKSYLDGVANLPITKQTIPAFLQANYDLPFFIADTDPSIPKTDPVIYHLDPLSNSAAWDSLTADKVADYSILRLAAGKAYKVLLDYTGKITELSFDESKTYSSDLLTQKVSEASSTGTWDTASWLNEQTLADESARYPQLVSLLGNSVIGAESSAKEYSYTTNGQAYSTSSEELRAMHSGYYISKNTTTQEDEFHTIGYARGFTNTGSIYGDINENPGVDDRIYILGNPYQQTKTQNALLQYPTDLNLSTATICQSYTFPYLLEDYGTSTRCYPASPQTELPALTYTSQTNGSTGHYYGMGCTDIEISEKQILNKQYIQKAAEFADALSTLINDPSGLVTELSEITPEYNYPVSGYAKYSYIKSANESLLGYETDIRKISIAALPFKLKRTSLYTSNLFNERNLKNSTYWTPTFEVLSSPNSFWGAQNNATDSDLTWKDGKEVPKWVFTINTFTATGDERTTLTLNFNLKYNPIGTRTITDPVEIYTAFKLSGLKTSGLNKIKVSALLYAQNKVIKEIDLTKEATAPATGYLAYKYAGTPGVSFATLQFKINFKDLTDSDISAAQNDYPRHIGVSVAKVSIRKYLKDYEEEIGLSDVDLHSAAANDDNAIYTAPHSIVLFKNNFQPMIITPLQFNYLSQTIAVSSQTEIPVATSPSNTSAAEFISNWWLKKLGPYSPYTKLVKPWIRKLVLTHKYVEVPEASLLGTNYSNDNEPIRCSSTLIDVHAINLVTDSYGVRRVIDQGPIRDLYDVKRTKTAGDGVIYHDEDTLASQVTASYFELQATGSAKTNDQSGLFFKVDSLNSPLLTYNSNLEVDTTDASSRYVPSSSGQVEDNYGLISITNETISLLTSTFNPKAFLSDNGQNSSETSPVLVTNVQLMGQTAVSKGGQEQLKDIILYEYEFLPIIYDEKTQHLSLNYFLYYKSTASSSN